MRLPIRYLLVIALLSYASQTVKAQCSASDILLQNVVSTGGTATTCSVTFDLSFTMETNNGNKFIFLHAWKQANYPNFFNCTDGHPATPPNGSIDAPEGSDL